MKLKSAIYGLAIGDALGVPYEFRKRGDFKCTDMVGYGTYKLPEGTWSDDTSMTLATCASIKEKGFIDISHIRKQFEKWLLHNEYTALGDVFDCGNTCYCAIKDGKGCEDQWSNGNGSLMRIIPLAFVEGISDEDIRNVSAITHAHTISKELCVKYVHIARSLGNHTGIQEAIKQEVDAELFDFLNNCTVDDIVSNGYVVNTFNAALWCLLNTDNYRDCVLKAVNLGSDTDTTAAVAGGLAGIVYGYEGIPAEWLEKLKAKDIIEACLF